MDAEPLRIWFEKIDGFVKTYGGIRYLVLFDSERYNAIYNRIKYLEREKSGIIDRVNHNFARIRIDSYNSLPAMVSCSRLIWITNSGDHRRV